MCVWVVQKKCFTLAVDRNVVHSGEHSSASYNHRNETG